MRFKAITAITVLAFLLCLGGCAEKTEEAAPIATAVPPADLVLINGTVYTVDADRSRAEAVAVRDGMIIAVGDDPEIERFIGAATRTVDLAGKMVLPGFHDAHVHPTMGGYALLGCDLANAHNVEAIIARVTQCAGEDEDEWLQGHAFDLGLFGQNGPDKSLLDAIDDSRPIILWASDGHSAWANSPALEQAGELSARVVTSLVFESGFARHYGDDFEQVLASRNQFESERLNHDSVKIFLDGVLEGETAALLEPYIGMHGDRGELILSPDELDAAVTRFDAMGLQVHMHGIGDRAVRAGLDAIAAAREQNGVSDNRHHISHLQLIHADDIERFASLDTTANFQADWAYPDQWIVELNLPLLGEERVQGMYPIASVERAGGRIVGGSDWNVSSANPLEAIETALRRQDAFEESGPVLNEGERVSLASMIDAYTINAAWLMHHEDITGSIEAGKRADFVVLDRDLFKIPPAEINEVQVSLTLLDGQLVYENQTGEKEELQGNE